MAFDGLVIHHSRDLRFRDPSGARPTGSQVRIGLEAAEAMRVQTVQLRLWRNSKEEFIPMERGKSVGGQVRYEVCLTLPEEPCVLFYYFLLQCGPGIRYYQNNAEGLGGEGELRTECDPMRSFQITVYDAAFTTPDWAKGAVMYQIFPDRFCKTGDFSVRGDCVKHQNWEEPVEYRVDPQKGYYPANDFFGGSLAGIRSKLPDLRALGVEVLYLNPIFRAYSNHRYDCADYETVDPLLGTNEDFSKLCAEAAKLGMRVILDGVFSHTGSDSRYFNRNGTFPEVGAYQSQDSPYAQWYHFRRFPDDYDCWWGVWSLPNVEENNPSYTAYMLSAERGIVPRWLARGASGWRLDVADELPDEFLFRLRDAVKRQNPDALVLGEVWEDASHKISYGALRPFLWGRQLDTVMNYPFRRALLDFLLSQEDARMLIRRVESLRENYPPQSFACLMNFLSSHDVPRAMTVLSGAPSEGLTKEEQANWRPTEAQSLLAVARCKLAAAVIFAMPGMPCVYYGDEAGLFGYADPFNRSPYPWGRENAELMAWYRACGQMRARQVLRRGELTLSGGGDLLGIGRTLNEERMVLLVNRGDSPAEAIVDPTLLPAAQRYRIELASQPGAVLQQREDGYAALIPALCAVWISPEED